MRTISLYLALLLLALLGQTVSAQDHGYKEKVKTLQERKNQITQQEKDALKLEIQDINKRLDNKRITSEEAKILKQAAAKKRALNIENRIAIIDNEIALLERNDGEILNIKEWDSTATGIRLSMDIIEKDGSSTIFNERWRWRKNTKYDRRTYSDLVLAIGFNNAIIEGESLGDSPYRVGGSRFFEMGWAWRTRVFRNTNFLRLNYGFSFQFNGLKPKENQIFVTNGDQTELQEFEFNLRKSKFRMDNLVFPVHFEFGPSKIRETEEKIRYSLDRQFRIGIGGYGGFNIGTRQKLKYNDDDGNRIKEKFKRDYNTSDFVYGLSAYVGVEGLLLYAKYDLSPIFKDAIVEQRNISLGLRFDL
ncbi:MAG: hypothetical protein WBG90_20640 [Saonia sp.]